MRNGAVHISDAGNRGRTLVYYNRFNCFALATTFFDDQNHFLLLRPLSGTRHVNIICLRGPIRWAAVSLSSGGKTGSVRTLDCAITEARALSQIRGTGESYYITTLLFSERF